MVWVLALWWFAAPAPQHWSDAQVAAALNHSHMSVLVRELQTAQCPAGLPHPVAFKADPYEVWLALVVAHLRSGQAFGPAYAPAAAQAYDEVYNIWYDCIKHTHDLDELQLRAEETPDRVGRELLALFAPTDRDTQRRAAVYLHAHYR